MKEHLSPTKQIILMSFSKLIEEKSFSDITVQDILDKSHVSRSTFYRNFHDKYEIMEIYYRIKVDTIINDTTTLGFKEVFYQIYDFAFQEKKFFQHLIRNDDEHSFYQFLLSYSIQYYKSLFSELTPKEYNLVSFVSRGQTGTMIQWIMDDCPISPSEFSDIMYDILPEDMKNTIKQ